MTESENIRIIFFAHMVNSYVLWWWFIYLRSINWDKCFSIGLSLINLHQNFRANLIFSTYHNLNYGKILVQNWIVLCHTNNTIFTSRVSFWIKEGSSDFKHRFLHSASRRRGCVVKRLRIIWLQQWNCQFFVWRFTFTIST